MTRPICKVCNTHPATSNGSLNGKMRYKTTCSSCHKHPWSKHKKDYCELCGFIPVNRVQLDVDHIDGNKENCNEDNYQTLCANCHRLKTYLNSDWQDKETLELESLQGSFIFES